jgi:hypothetical protein
MACKRCEERGKTWEGSDPKCAFDDNGVFNGDNWNCATMNKLRNIAEELETGWRDDNSCGSIGYVPMDNDYAPDDFNTYGGYIVMMWYKERGRTGNAVFMTDEETMPLTVKHAELAIKTYEIYKGRR